MDKPYKAIYRQRLDGDWDFILLLGLDAEPAASLAELLRDYFGADEEEHAIVPLLSPSHVVDVWDGPLPADATLLRIIGEDEYQTQSIGGTPTNHEIHTQPE